MQEINRKTGQELVQNFMVY